MSTTEVVLSFAVIGLVIYIYNSTAKSPSTCTTTSAGCKKKKGSKKKRSQTVGKEEEIVFIDKKQKDLLQSEQPVIRKKSKEKSKNQPVFKEEEPKPPQKIQTKNEVIEVSPKLSTSVNEYEDAGWDEVKPKYSKTLKIISNSQPSTAFVHQKKEIKVKDNKELTKKQKQNLRKAERVKELKTASSSIQQERLQAHRKAQERAHIQSLIDQEKLKKRRSELSKNDAPKRPFSDFNNLNNKDVGDLWE